MEFNKKFQVNDRERPKQYLPSTPQSPQISGKSSDLSTPVSVNVLKERFQQASAEKSKLDSIKAERKAELAHVKELREIGFLAPGRACNSTIKSKDSSTIASASRNPKKWRNYNTKVDQALEDLGFLSHDPTAPPLNTLPPAIPIVTHDDESTRIKRSKYDCPETLSHTNVQSENPVELNDDFLQLLAAKNSTQINVSQLESRKRKSDGMTPPCHIEIGRQRPVDRVSSGHLSSVGDVHQYSDNTSYTSRESEQSSFNNCSLEGITYSEDVDSSCYEENDLEDYQHEDISDDMTEVTSTEFSESCVQRNPVDSALSPSEQRKSRQRFLHRSSKISLNSRESVADTNEYYEQEDACSFADTQNTSDDCNREELDSLLEDAFEKVLPKETSDVISPSFSSKLSTSPRVTPNRARGRHRRSLSADCHILDITTDIGLEAETTALPTYSEYSTPYHTSAASSPEKINAVLGDPSKTEESSLSKSTPTAPLKSISRHDDEVLSDEVRSRLARLHSQVDREEAVITQTSKALIQCKKKADRFLPGSAEHVESCRLLLIACQKRQALLEEIQRLGHMRFIHRGLSGSLTISGIKLTLKPGYIQSKNSLQSLYGVVGATEQHHILILIKCPGQGRVIHTEMVTVVPSRDSHINSPSVFPQTSQTVSSPHPHYVEVPSCFSINNLPPGFRTSIEVYGMSIYNSCSTPAKSLSSNRNTSMTSLISNRSALSSSNNVISTFLAAKTPNLPSGRKFRNLFRLPSSASKSSTSRHTASDMSTPDRSKASYFSLIASEELTISALTKSSSLALSRVPNSFPLDGTLQFQASLNMDNNLQLSGFLSKFEEVGGFGNWSRAWWHLQGDRLLAWRYPEHVPSPTCKGTDKNSIYCVDLLSVINERVELAPEDVCPRPALLLVVIRKARHCQEGNTLVTDRRGDWIREKVLLSAESREERINWQDKINSTLMALQEWMPDHFVQLRSTSKLFI